MEMYRIYLNGEAYCKSLKYPVTNLHPLCYYYKTTSHSKPKNFFSLEEATEIENVLKKDPENLVEIFELSGNA